MRATAAASKKWETVQIADWRHGKVNTETGGLKDYDDEHLLIQRRKDARR